MNHGNCPMKAQAMLELADDIAEIPHEVNLTPRQARLLQAAANALRESLALRAPALAGVAAREALRRELHISSDFDHRSWEDIERAFAAIPPSQEVPAEPIEEWIEREFSGYGVAVRSKDESPIPGEPFMSMAEAKKLLRRALRTFAAPPQCAQDSKERVQEIIGKLAKDEPSKFLQWENDSWRTYYTGFDLTEFAMLILAALAGKPGAAQDQLSRLRQAILDNTQGDGFWLGEILLAVLAKETGFNGSVTRPNSDSPVTKSSGCVFCDVGIPPLDGIHYEQGEEIPCMGAERC